MVGLSIVLEGLHDRRSVNISSNSNSSSSGCSSSSSPSQVVNKSNMIKTMTTTTTTSPSSSSPSSSTKNPFSRRSYSLPNNRNLPSISFLEHCFLCRQRLLPGKDIYMYKGDRAFCSEECRCRQIFMDEEESIKAKKDNCSLAAINKSHHVSSSSSSSSPSSPSSSRASGTRKGASKRANGFAY